MQTQSSRWVGRGEAPIWSAATRKDSVAFQVAQKQDYGGLFRAYLSTKKQPSTKAL